MGDLMISVFTNTVTIMMLIMITDSGIVIQFFSEQSFKVQLLYLIIIISARKWIMFHLAWLEPFVILF